MRVLVVEDEVYLAEAIRAGLRLEAIAADLAFDGDAALESVSLNEYDVVVLDRDIPGTSGDEVCRRIVAQGLPLRVLMLTAAGDIDDKVSGFELGRRRLSDQTVRAAGAGGADPGARLGGRPIRCRRCSSTPGCGSIRSGGRSTGSGIT